jgi:hypothetical protein
MIPDDVQTTSRTPDLRAVVTRLENLEKENRTLKRTWAVALVVVTVAVLAGQTLPQSRVLEVEALRLVDKGGTQRAGFAVLEDGPFLTLLDPDGTLRVVLGLGSEGPRLSFRDEAGAMVWEVPRGP